MEAIINDYSTKEIVNHATLVFCNTVPGLYMGITTDLYAGLAFALNTSGRALDYDMVSIDGEPIRTLGGVKTILDKSIADVDNTDLVMIPAVWGDMNQILDQAKSLIPWLIRQYEQGAILVAHGTAVALLAETGLLDGKSTTIYWEYFDAFEKKYPQITLDRKRHITSQERIYCSNGLGSGLDLGIYLVEKFWGVDIALQLEKQLLVGFKRGYSNEYIDLIGQHYHGDDLVLSIQQWMEVNFNQAIDLDSVSQRFQISVRSLKRRFKAATGITPLKYVQQIRLETARESVKHTNKPISQICFDVGYEDFSYFSSLFKRYYELTPTAYRQRYSGETE